MQTRLLSYQAGDTLLHRANPFAKLLLAFGVVVATFIAQQFTVLLFIALLIVIGMACARVLSALSGLIRAMVILACVMFVLQTLIAQRGAYLFLWFTPHGLDVAAKAAVRVFCFALPLVSVLTITKLTDVANAVVKYLHIPYCYAFTITTAVRFVPIFAYEMQQITQAQSARGVEFDTKNPFKKIQLMMPLIVPLLVSSVRKADSCALAAENRGFYLRTRASAFRQYHFGLFDVLLVVIACAMIALPIVSVFLLPMLY